MADYAVIKNLLRCDFDCDNDQLDKYARYIDLLLQWNKKINLTSVKDHNQCWEKHIYDSLLASDFIQPQQTVLDIGSGAGLPAIPLCIHNSKIYVTSIDCVNKKVLFQRHCKRILALNNFTVISGRVENLISPNGYDVVMSRAFAAVDKMVEMSVNLLAENGTMVLLKSAGYPAELAAASMVLKKNSLQVKTISDFVLPISGAQRTIIVLTRQ